MKNTKLLKALTGLALIALPAQSNGALVQWNTGPGANGHWYEFISTSLSWQQAANTAAAQTFSGVSGHLVTITSAEENSFVHSLIPVGQGGWIGASDAAVEGEWRWVTGPEAGTQFWQGNGATGVPLGYENWSTPNQPTDNSFPGEDFGNISHSGGGLWFDGQGNEPGNYIIEFSTNSAVPEPATNALIAVLGLLFFMRLRKKRR